MNKKAILITIIGIIVLLLTTYVISVATSDDPYSVWASDYFAEKRYDQETGNDKQRKKLNEQFIF